MIDSHCHLDHEPLFENIDDILKGQKMLVLKNCLLFVLHLRVLIKLKI